MKKPGKISEKIHVGIIVVIPAKIPKLICSNTLEWTFIDSLGIIAVGIFERSETTTGKHYGRIRKTNFCNSLLKHFAVILVEIIRRQERWSFINFRELIWKNSFKRSMSTSGRIGEGILSEISGSIFEEVLESMPEKISKEITSRIS